MDLELLPAAICIPIFVRISRKKIWNTNCKSLQFVLIFETYIFSMFLKMALSAMKAVIFSACLHLRFHFFISSLEASLRQGTMTYHKQIIEPAL